MLELLIRICGQTQGNLMKSLSVSSTFVCLYVQCVCLHAFSDILCVYACADSVLMCCLYYADDSQDRLDQRQDKRHSLCSLVDITSSESFQRELKRGRKSGWNLLDTYYVVIADVTEKKILVKLLASDYVVQGHFQYFFMLDCNKTFVFSASVKRMPVCLQNNYGSSFPRAHHL